MKWIHNYKILPHYIKNHYPFSRSIQTVAWQFAFSKGGHVVPSCLLTPTSRFETGSASPNINFNSIWGTLFSIVDSEVFQFLDLQYHTNDWKTLVVELSIFKENKYSPEYSLTSITKSLTHLDSCLGSKSLWTNSVDYNSFFCICS